MTKHTTADIVIVVLVGERGREATEFIDETLGQAGLENSVVVLATSEASPVLRRKANDTGHTIAEYFRDQGLNVLLLVDSLTRVAHAEREIGLAAGEPPTSKGYPPSVFSKLPRIMERGGMSDGEGSITSIYTVLLEFETGDDPIVEVARSSLDGQIMLSREMADAGIYPAVNLKGSISRLSQRVVDKNLTDLARDFRRLWTKFEQNRDLIMVGAYESGSDEELDRAIRMRKEMESFIEQDLSVGCSLSSSTEQLDQLMGRQFSGHEVGHVVKDIEVDVQRLSQRENVNRLSVSKANKEQLQLRSAEVLEDLKGALELNSSDVFLIINFSKDLGESGPRLKEISS